MVHSNGPDPSRGSRHAVLGLLPLNKDSEAEVKICAACWREGKALLLTLHLICRMASLPHGTTLTCERRKRWAGSVPLSCSLLTSRSSSISSNSNSIGLAEFTHFSFSPQMLINQDMLGVTFCFCSLELDDVVSSNSQLCLHRLNEV